MLELTPLVAGSARANRPETSDKSSPWKKILMLFVAVGLIGVAVTQMPKLSGNEASPMNAKEAIVMEEPVLVANDYADKCGPTAASVSPAHTFVKGRVIGCDGPIRGGMFSGSAESLCDVKGGWRVCRSQNDARTQGLTAGLCAAAPLKKFFATQQRGLGFHKCEGTGANDVFGCGGKGLGLASANAASCGPLDRTGGNLFKSYNGKQWSCANCNKNGLDELLKIQHTLNGAKSFDGGVMCCKSGPIQCNPGQYLSSGKCHTCPVGHKCAYNSKTICPKGSYQANRGKATCKKADCGFFVPAAGGTAQEPCRPGTYSKAGAWVCTPAAPGYYSGAQACKQLKCPVGSYQDCDGQSSCPKPPCGHYVPTKGSKIALPCPAGTYQPKQGQNTCKVTQPGQYAGKGHCKPRLCTPGYFQPLTKQSACKPANCGKFVAGAGSAKQAACGAGEYQPQPGQSTCLPIPAGYVSINKKCGIKCCPPGTFRDKNFQCKKARCGYFVPRKCMSDEIRCPPGTWSAPGASSCTPALPGTVPNGKQCGTVPCAPGTYQDGTGQVKCKKTKCGFKAPSPGMKKPTACPPGSYQDQKGQTKCIPCAAGSANPKSAQCSCPLCKPGFFQGKSGRVSCHPSPCGHFVKQAGAKKPQPCPPGKYQDKTRQTGCIKAPPGKYAVGGKCAPQTCPAGTFTSSAGSVKCTEAYCGTYVSKAGQTSPVTCKPGQYQPLTGQTACLATPTGSYTDKARQCVEKLCTPGYFQNLVGQTGCKPAQCGHFVKIKGADSQSPCGAGRFQDKTRQTSCKKAALGHFVGKNKCKQDRCPAGTYTDCQGQSYCQKAPCGHFVRGTGKSNFQACPAGTFQDLVGQAGCKTTPAGSYSKSGYCSAMKCDPGYFQNLAGKSSCKAAGCGYFVSGEGRKQASACPAGSFQPKTGQVGCYRTTLKLAPNPGSCRKMPKYFGVKSKKKWADAQKYCKGRGGQLAVIKTAAENAAAFKVCKATTAGGPTICWIGGSDAAVENKWKWVDGSMFGYTNWGPGQPNNLGKAPGQDCAAFDGSKALWGDGWCTVSYSFVCEKY